MKIFAEPGRYFAAGSMDLVTSIVAIRRNNREYFSQGELSNDMAENIYYINDSIYGSLSNIIYEKATYSVTVLSKNTDDSDGQTQTLMRSSVYGPTCDSYDCLSKAVDLPSLEIADHLLIYHVGAYSIACSTKFNGFETNKYVYIWKD